MLENGKRYLVTTDDWFLAPDGELYRAVWGTSSIEKIEDTLGFIPIRPSTNWYMKVGNENNYIIIAGCKIHYVCRCEDKPKSNHAGKLYKDKDTGSEWNEDRIYYAE